jgi:hypothetical protein
VDETYPICRGEIAMKTGAAYRYNLVGRAPRRKTSHEVFDGTLQNTQVPVKNHS